MEILPEKAAEGRLGGARTWPVFGVEGGRERNDSTTAILSPARVFSVTQGISARLLDRLLGGLLLAMAPRIPWAQLFAEHAAINLDMTRDDGRTDIAAGGFDAGVRLGEMLDKDMIAVSISPARSLTSARAGWRAT